MLASRKQWIGAAALALVVPTSWALVRLLGESSVDLTAFHGVRLGMTSSDVRARFDIPGDWQAGPIDAGGLGLSFSPRDPSSSVHEARFEFHDGILVAVRARLAQRDPWAAGDAVETSPGAVSARRRDGSDVAFTLLARNCPVHAAEVDRLLGAAS